MATVFGPEGNSGRSWAKLLLVSESASNHRSSRGGFCPPLTAVSLFLLRVDIQEVQGLPPPLSALSQSSGRPGERPSAAPAPISFSIYRVCVELGFFYTCAQLSHLIFQTAHCF